MESDQMKIEFVFGELTRTIQLLEKQGTVITNDLVTEITNVYTENNNMIVPLSAFLLTTDGSLFWQECSLEKKRIF